MKKALLISTTLFCINLHAQTLPDSIQVSTYAGTGVSANTDGPAASTSFNNPTGICMDAAGNFYIADGSNHVIRKITSAGIVSTFAGSGVQSYSNGTGSGAGFDSPAAICSDSIGNLYVTDIHYDNGYSMIRKITPAGVVTTVATVSIYDNDYATGICIDKKGNLYVTDVSTYAVYKITPSGKISTVAGSGLTFPQGICIDNSGNLYVADAGDNQVKKITPAGVVSTVAGSGAWASVDGNGTSASFDAPGGICIDALGNLYVTESGANKIRKIKTNGDVITIAGNGTRGCKDDIGKNSEFYFSITTPGLWYENVGGIMVTKSGTLYMTDGFNNKIREIQQLPAPTPPVINYPGINAHVCMGSELNYQPAATGSSASITLQVDSFYTGHQKGICKTHNSVYVLCKGDSVMRFDFDGNYIQTYNNLPYYQNVTAIAADDSGRVYLAGQDNTNSLLSNIYRIDKYGNTGSLNPLSSGYILKVSALCLGPDGKLYIADTNTNGVTSGYITTEDTNTGTPTRFSTATTTNSFNIVTGMTFGKNNQLFVTDIGDKNIFVRNAATDSYYPYFSALDTLNWIYNSIAVDTIETGLVYVSTKTDVMAMIRNIGVHGDTTAQLSDFKQLGLHLHAPSGIVNVVSATNIPQTWIADTNSNYVKRVAIFAYQISPNLPQGLSYNFLNGQITGTPTVATVTQTYTITVTSQYYGTKTSTLTFSVDPPAPLSNTTGSVNSKVVNQTDGLSVDYNDSTGCAKIIKIADSIAGGSPGFTQVKQTVYPTIATFAASQFVPRVTQVNAQNPNAPAGLTMYFTYQDIVNFDATTTGPKLTNDTTGGTMQVAVLQLHKDSNGNYRPIPHSPITAKWISKDKDWEVDFPVTEFSTFYMGATSVVSSFTCANSHNDTITTSNGYYIWQKYDSLTSSGTYVDTLTNMTGCDSVCTLVLTFNPTGISTPLLANSTKVYPNPSTGLVYVNINNPNIDVTNLKITLTNILGETVYNNTGSGHNLTLDLSGLEKGCYILNITSDKETINKRIVLE